MSGPGTRLRPYPFTREAVKKSGPDFTAPAGPGAPGLGSGRSFHFHFGIEVGDDILECLDRLLNCCDLHQLPVFDRTVAILQRDNQIPPLLLKLNKR